MSEDELGLVEAPAPSVQEMAMSANYWTAAARAQAKPVPMPKVTVQQHHEVMKHLRAKQEAAGATRSVVVPPTGGTNVAATVSSSVHPAGSNRVSHFPH